MKRAILIGATIAVAVSSSAFAWHNQGHMMTAEVAWKHLTPGTRCRAVKLLRSDPEFSRGLANPSGLDADQALFVNAATWPDRIKLTGSGFTSDGDDADAAGAAATQNLGLTDKLQHKYWHFIDYPLPDDPARPPPSVNAAERIQLFTAALKNPATPEPLRAYDLAWLLHLVGDIHQPLHAASQYGSVFTRPAVGSDAGGNDVVVSWQGYRELHGFWDGAPGDTRDDTQVLAASVAAADALATAPKTKAAKKSVVGWAKESHALGVKYAYVSPIALQSQGPFTLTPAYVSKAQQIATQRIALGGARLAKLLNAALTYPEPGC